MKIIKTLIWIALIGFLITLNLYAFKEPKNTLHDIIYEWRYLFWSVEGILLLTYTHIKSYTFASKKLISKMNISSMLLTFRDDTLSVGFSAGTNPQGGNSYFTIGSYYVDVKDTNTQRDDEYQKYQNLEFHWDEQEVYLNKKKIISEN